MIQIICDTREQRPFSFDPTKFTVTRGTLATGDYSIAGLETVVTVERKSLGDLVSTLIHDWLRARKEFIRMSGFEVAAIVVEADMSDIIAKRYESDASPSSVIGRMNAIFLDHGIPVFLWGAQPKCMAPVESFFALAAKKLGRV